MNAPARRIALLGAESTGKSRLAAELGAHFAAQGLRAAAVSETLREWCAREGREPRPEEQLPIAREHERRVDAAAATHDVVIADTTALMVAIYAGQLFPDGDLLTYAIARQRAYGATLVTGLDLPWVADGLHRDGAHAREPVDALVRDALRDAGIAFHVVYGTGNARLRNALAALDAAPPADAPQRPWKWMCDSCSDPDCEHRLFTGLRDRRGD